MTPFHVVLLGVGHTSAHVLRQWRMQPPSGARLTCVSPFPVAAYSGLLPGVLAGQYPPEAMEIDLVRLCAAAGARLVLEDVLGLDTPRQELLFADRPPMPFDALVIGVGSTPSRRDLLEADELLVPVKPMQTLLARLETRLVARRPAPASEPDAPLRMVIVGGGAGGVELACCLPQFVERAAPGRRLELTLVDAHARLLQGAAERTAALVQGELARRGVTVIAGQRVVRAANGQVVLASGARLPADLCLWAAGAASPPVLDRLELPRDERGFLQTDATLRIADPRPPPIFAVGDCGAIAGTDLPKAGVYAVRQGPVLWENLQRLRQGRPLIDYRPQPRFLKLLNLGDGTAVGEYAGWSFRGRWVWRWKDTIDRRFLEKHQVPAAGMLVKKPDYSSAMAMTADASAMRCLGCGGKLAAGVLSRALARLSRDLVRRGGKAIPADDAALVTFPVLPAGVSQVAVTTDIFTAPLADPYLSGRIAALHAASDLLAKGARPSAALALVTLPEAPDREQEQLLYELLSGGVRELSALGCRLVGGHSTAGDSLALGFTLLGPPGPRWLAKSSVRPGDLLVLTKPLGVGVLLRALRQAQLPAAHYPPLLAALLQSNLLAAELMESCGASAATDVTGFGLAGHLLEMLTPYGGAAEVALDALPYLPGAVELLAAGRESSLAPANRECEPQLDAPPQTRSRPEFALLFDPQTSGGLLVALPAPGATDLVRRLTEQGHPAAVIGRITATAGEPRITVRESAAWVR